MAHQAHADGQPATGVTTEVPLAQGIDDRRFLPALRFGWLTPAYDPLLRWILRERLFKRNLLASTGLRPGQRVLDLGCGTGTLTLQAKRHCPAAETVGLDADFRILDRARGKTRSAGLDVAWQVGLSFEIPFPDGSFDHVLSSLLFHHLTSEKKRRTLADVFRVLRPGGGLHVADWGQARSSFERVAFLAVQLLDGFSTTTDSVRGLLPQYMVEAGFAGVRESGRVRTALGVISIYRARRPVAGAE